jgi:hypothetical protein
MGDGEEVAMGSVEIEIGRDSKRDSRGEPEYIELYPQLLIVPG